MRHTFPAVSHLHGADGKFQPVASHALPTRRDRQSERHERPTTGDDPPALPWIRSLQEVMAVRADVR